MIDSSFQYIIPLFNDNLEDASPIQGFSPGILDSPKFILCILSLPATIFELAFNRNQCIAARAHGISNYRIIPLGMEFLIKFPVRFDQPFICLFSDEKTIVTVKEFIKKIDLPIMHISTVDDSSAIKLDKINKDHLRSYVEQVRIFLKPRVKTEIIQLIDRALAGKAFYPEEPTNIKRRNHNVTVPNELALSYFNFQFTNQEMLIGNDNDPYIKAITASAQSVIAEREKALTASEPIIFPQPINLIVTCPSMYRHLYIKDRKWKEIQLNPDEIKALISVYKVHIRQSDYCFHSTGPHLASILKSKYASYFVGMRQEELQAYTAAISVKTCNYFIPSLRLPPSVNMLHQDLTRLGNCSRDKHPHKKFGKMKHMNQLTKTIIERLSNIIPNDFIPIIDRDNNQIKLVTDAPLEWLPIRGLPLMLRYDTSRIPTTPGNLFFQQTIDTEKIVLPYSAFKEVLIIRSFDDADPCKMTTEISLKTIQEPPDEESYNILSKIFPLDQDSFMKSKLDMDIKVVDVRNSEDFINALNTYEGAILIYDGHGSHGEETDIGTLRIGKEDLDIVQLRKKVRVPPIVLLSACDTHPIDASHASTANAFLIIGAKTVLATVLPLEAPYAALFIGRLLLRVSMFLSLAVRYSPIKWTWVISGLQRMSFITELKHALISSYNLSLGKKEYLRIGAEANHMINSGDNDWFEKSLQIISEETKLSTKDISDYIKNHFQITEVLKYIQLGNPELIIIVNDTYYNGMNLAS